MGATAGRHVPPCAAQVHFRRGARQEGAAASTEELAVTYIGDSLRVCRADGKDGSTVRIYQRMDAGAAQGEIGKLLSAPVPRDDGSAAMNDDMPLWERRLLEERARGYQGPGTSADIM